MSIDITPEGGVRAGEDAPALCSVTIYKLQAAMLVRGLDIGSRTPDLQVGPKTRASLTPLIQSIIPAGTIDAEFRAGEFWTECRVANEINRLGRTYRPPPGGGTTPTRTPTGETPGRQAYAALTTSGTPSAPWWGWVVVALVVGGGAFWVSRYMRRT